MLENLTNNCDVQYIDLVANSFAKINSCKETIKVLLCTNIFLPCDYIITKDYDFGRVAWDTIHQILAITSSDRDMGIQWDASENYNAYIFVESMSSYTRLYVRKKRDSSREYMKPLLEEYPNLGYFILRVESIMPDVINWLKDSL